MKSILKKKRNKLKALLATSQPKKHWKAKRNVLFFSNFLEGHILHAATQHRKKKWRLGGCQDFKVSVYAALHIINLPKNFSVFTLGVVSGADIRGYPPRPADTRQRMRVCDLAEIANGYPNPNGYPDAKRPALVKHSFHHEERNPWGEYKLLNIII
jgi:hypothetical protein